MTDPYDLPEWRLERPWQTRHRENMKLKQREKHAKTRHDDVTYFIAGGGLVKIGRTNNLPVRFQNLQAASPVPLQILAFTISLSRTLNPDLSASMNKDRQEGL